MGWFVMAEGLARPVFEIIRPIPPVAWIPLTIFWFGIGLPGKIFIIWLGGLVPCVINAYVGVKMTKALRPRPWRWPCCPWPRNTKILLVEPAVADSITGDKWNKYTFSALAANSGSRTPAANAAALDQSGNVITVLANDSAFGRDGVKASKAFTVCRSCTKNTCPWAPPFTAGLQRIIDKLKDQPERQPPVGDMVGRARVSPRLPTWIWKSATVSR